jgi:hypothetical protein
VEWLEKQRQWPNQQAVGKVVRVRKTREKTRTETAH